MDNVVFLAHKNIGLKIICNNLAGDCDEPFVEIPDETQLLLAYPNPIQNLTSVQFGLPNATRVTLKIYDFHGHEVKVLLDAHLEAGFHSIHWDGLDNHGQSLPNGLYLCSMDTGKEIKSLKILLAR